MKKNLLNVLTVSVVLLAFVATISCSSDDNVKQPIKPESGSEILSKHVWITTNIVDNRGGNISLDVMPGAMYAGYAYYNADGTFRIVDFKDGHKMYGLWSLKDQDAKRHLVVYNSENKIAFERSVDIVELNNSIFTYKIGDQDNAEIMYDVEHKPVTDHPEPKTPAEVLASVVWTTTKVFDITNGVTPVVELDKTIAPAANFSGDAYYINKNGKAYFPKSADGKYSNGTFLITAYGDKDNVRSQGDWYVSLDGKLRTLIGRAADGSVTFERTVSIVELTDKKFTYDIKVDDVVLRVEHEPIQ
ncbi:DUF4822 domain-containing protein [Myroides odoratus]|uniref:DUF4822 domain-containing protein n=1 Tax=Myroides odoratus TaxID=256 RepID=A0A9Q6Z4Q4_MYROD|nr:DUF4822 domain-containing protein [Myroides odoratus]EHQ43007.1 hypothetical protein Myrod_2180 [Myroides odoratus DSM 2801]EKB07317.1 hypothetical protein HMPREF9716_02040 [Myroides odoratus CIP 103059]QQU00356.1 DUF4822 domain-containing protein [Myroides odoratus]WQD57416.1 DUF4822 domain-containing protein [Myroides odoratus]STZ30275.1 Uncharacterised protein [Myroides odoratus]